MVTWVWGLPVRPILYKGPRFFILASATRASHRSTKWEKVSINSRLENTSLHYMHVVNEAWKWNARKVADRDVQEELSQADSKCLLSAPWSPGKTPPADVASRGVSSRGGELFNNNACTTTTTTLRAPSTTLRHCIPLRRGMAADAGLKVMCLNMDQ